MKTEDKQPEDKRTEWILKCGKCGGHGFIQKGKSREACSCVLEWNILACLRGLGPRLYPGKDVEAVVQSIEANVSVHLTTSLVSTQKLNGVAAQVILQVWKIKGRRPSYRHMTTYDLVLRWLQDRPEEPISEDILILYHLPNQPPNKDLGSLIAQIIDWRTRQGKSTWFLRCGGAGLPEGLKEEFFVFQGFQFLTAEGARLLHNEQKANGQAASRGYSPNPD